MNANDILKQGGSGAALAYLLVTAPTEWWGVLPPVPEAHYVGIVTALGGVLTAVLRLPCVLRLLGLAKPADTPVTPEKTPEA